MRPEKRSLRRPLGRPTLFAIVVLASSFGGMTVERPPEAEPDVPTFAPTTSGLAKGKNAGLGPVVESESDAEGHVEVPLLGTLAHTHTNEHLPLTASEPTIERFSAFLADRVTDSSHPIDPRLIALLRTLAARHPGARFEIVSGYRSKKLTSRAGRKGAMSPPTVNIAWARRSISGSCLEASSEGSTREGSRRKFEPRAGTEASASTRSRAIGSSTPT